MLLRLRLNSVVHIDSDETRPKILGASEVDNTGFNVSWETNISGIVNIAVVAENEEKMLENRIIVGWDITAAQMHIIFKGKINITVEVYNDCRQNFTSKPHLLEIDTTKHDESSASANTGRARYSYFFNNYEIWNLAHIGGSLLLIVILLAVLAVPAYYTGMLH